MRKAILARNVRPGRIHHGTGAEIARHIHDHAFATLVLEGGYTELGDTGRHRQRPGSVLLHRAYEQHRNLVECQGTEIFVLSLRSIAALPVAGYVGDPDAIIRAAERDPSEALNILQSSLIEIQPRPLDWPDLLAQALRADPSCAIGAWADAHGLNRASVSRGFRQTFGVTPGGFRIAQRVHRAIASVQASIRSFSATAHDCGFADQAHMTRCVRYVTGLTPTELRRRATSPDESRSAAKELPQPH